MRHRWKPLPRQLPRRNPHHRPPRLKRKLQPRNRRSRPAGETPAAALNAAQEAKEKAQYRAVRTKALEDKQIQELREQMDAAVGDEQRQRATRRYYSALFDKMREIDPSLKARINRMEAAAKRRMGRSKSAEPSGE